MSAPLLFPVQFSFRTLDKSAMYLQVLLKLSRTKEIKCVKSLIKCCSPLPSLKEVERRRRGGALCLFEGLFEVSEQHGGHDALLCVDGEQGSGVLQLQRYQKQGSAANCSPSEPAGEQQQMGQLH